MTFLTASILKLIISMAVIEKLTLITHFSLPSWRASGNTRSIYVVTWFFIQTVSASERTSLTILSFLANFFIVYTKKNMDLHSICTRSAPIKKHKATGLVQSPCGKCFGSLFYYNDLSEND